MTSFVVAVFVQVGDFDFFTLSIYIYFYLLVLVLSLEYGGGRIYMFSVRVENN